MQALRPGTEGNSRTASSQWTWAGVEVDLLKRDLETMSIHGRGSRSLLPNGIDRATFCKANPFHPLGWVKASGWSASGAVSWRLTWTIVQTLG